MAFLEIARPREALRRQPRRARLQPRRREGRVRLLPRPVGLRQDDDAADDRRLRDARPAARSASTARTSSTCKPEPAQHRHGLPVLRAVPEHDRGAERRLRAARSPARAKADADKRVAEMLGMIDLPDLGEPLSVPAVRRPAAARRARPGARHRSRRSCSSTSRCRRSTPRSASRCARRSARSSASSASPRSTSPTTRKRRCRCPTGSW